MSDKIKDMIADEYWSRIEGLPKLVKDGMSIYALREIFECVVWPLFERRIISLPDTSKAIMEASDDQ